MKRNLWILVKKDLHLCPEWIVFGVILMIIMPRYIIRAIGDTGSFLELILILCAICASNLAISRICYIEDNQAVKIFLSSLPVTRKELITARFLFAAGLTVAFLLLAEGLGILMGVPLTLVMLLMGALIGLTYESVYLLVYYKWGNQVAQYTLILFVGIAAAIGWTFL